MGFFTTTRRRTVKPWLKPHEKPSKGVVIKFSHENQPQQESRPPAEAVATVPVPDAKFIAKYRKA